MEQLHINEHTYSSNMKKIKNFDRSRVLHRHKEPELANVREGKLMNKVISQTAEKSKPKNYQVYAIIQRMYDYSIRLDHLAKGIRTVEQRNERKSDFRYFTG